MADVPETPLTRLEQYWAGILDKIEGGGGGNPNYVKTITGTLANPWGDVDPAELLAEIQANNATCMMEIDGTSIGGLKFTAVELPIANNLFFEVIGATGNNVADWMAMGIAYGATYELTSVYLLRNDEVIDYYPYASIVPTTLTIIHHPLPDTTP